MQKSFNDYDETKKITEYFKDIEEAAHERKLTVERRKKWKREQRRDLKEMVKNGK